MRSSGEASRFMVSGGSSSRFSRITMRRLNWSSLIPATASLTRAWYRPSIRSRMMLLGTDTVSVSASAATGCAELNVICHTTSDTCAWIAAAQASHNTVASVIVVSVRIVHRCGTCCGKVGEGGKRSYEAHSALCVGGAT